MVGEPLQLPEELTQCLTISIKKMKKVILALAVLAMIGFASCSKEKDCKCTATVSGVSVDLGVYHITEGSCSDLETTIAGYSVVTCEKN